jgi:GNAT superfamily N-acetyltransferase
VPSRSHEALKTAACSLLVPTEFEYTQLSNVNLRPMDRNFPMIKITFLADHTDAVPVLARWFRAQWPGYFAGRPLTEIEQDFHAEANRNSLPTRLVAFVDNELAGTLVLRERAFGGLMAYSPGLGGLYVAEPYRRRGVGAELIRAGMDLSRAQGYETVYAATSVAHGLFQRLGWALIDTVLEGQEQVGIYRCVLIA